MICHTTHTVPQSRRTSQPLHKIDEFEDINFTMNEEDEQCDMVPVINILDILRENPFRNMDISMVEEREELASFL